MNERLAVALYLLKDESLPAQQAGTQLPVQCDRQLGAESSTEKAVLLHNEIVGQPAEVDGNDSPGIGSREGHPAPHRAPVAEVGEEERLSRQYPRSGLEELVHHPAVGRGTVAHPCLIGYALLHVNHGACLGDDGLTRIKRYLHKLDIVAEDFVIDLMRCHIISVFQD